jgi:hypothetical protein
VADFRSRFYLKIAVSVKATVPILNISTVMYVVFPTQLSGQLISMKQKKIEFEHGLSDRKACKWLPAQF